MKKLLMLIGAVLFSVSVNAETLSLTSDNTIVLDEEVNSSSVGKVMQEAKALDAKLASGYPIYLFLYTPGGSIQAGIELIEFLNGLNRPVHTVTLFAASMGFQIAQHMGKRYIVKYGVLMSHKARGSFGGEFGGTLSQIDTRYSLWLRRIKLMDEQTVKRTKGKQTLQSYINAYSPELWLNGAEAVKDGYADQVVTVKCDDSLSGTRSSVVDYGFFKVNITTSKCPIQTGVLGVSANIVTNQGIMNLDKFLQNNGTFGGCTQTVEKEPTYGPYSYRYGPYSTDEEEVVTSDLCAKDPSLTLEKIRTTMKDEKKKATSDPKNNVIYSY